MKALHAGKHVLLEKPSANTAAEAREMFALAKKKGLVLLEAFHYRYVSLGMVCRTTVSAAPFASIRKLELINNLFFLQQVPPSGPKVQGNCG